MLGDPGRRRRLPPSSTSTRSAARTSWSSTAPRWSSTPDGDLVARAAQFAEEPPRRRRRRPPALRTRLLDRRGRSGAGPPAPSAAARPAVEPVGRGRRALLDRSPRCTRRWCSAPATTSRKNGFTDVVIGLSGGIDSSLVAAIAADALGPEHVHGVLMPSRYSSDHSITDAEALADNLGIDHRTIPIEPAHAAFLEHARAVVRRAPARPHRGEPPDPHPRHDPDGAVEQVRLAACSPPATRARWRSATPRSTATSAGGFAVIKDVPKLLVYELCRDRNAAAGPRAHPRVGARPSRRRPSCAPTSATTRACRPTRCSTRSSRPTSRATSPPSDIVAPGPRRRPSSTASPGSSTCAEYKRRQRRPASAGHPEGVRQGPPPARSPTATAGSLAAVPEPAARPVTGSPVGRRRPRGRRHRPGPGRPPRRLLLGRAAALRPARRLDHRDPRARREARRGRARRPRRLAGPALVRAAAHRPPGRRRPGGGPAGRGRGPRRRRGAGRRAPTAPSRSWRSPTGCCCPAWPPRCGPTSTGRRRSRSPPWVGCWPSPSTTWAPTGWPGSASCRRWRPAPEALGRVAAAQAAGRGAAGRCRGPPGARQHR